MKSRTALGAAAIATAALALPAPASAHVYVTPAEAPSGGFADVDFKVPHGCEGSSTTEITIQIPESVPSVTPGRSPFYELATKEGPKDEVELHGETLTEGISEVTWTATEPLPDHELDTLPMSITMPALDPGEVVYFPTIQKCEKGETRWIEIPAEGESEEDLESPAPAITLTEPGEGEGNADDSASHADETADGDDGDAEGLAIAALVVGGLGLVVGGTALARSRS
jgi:periplasmic copper chaperone A